MKFIRQRTLRDNIKLLYVCCVFVHLFLSIFFAQHDVLVLAICNALSVLMYMAGCAHLIFSGVNNHRLIYPFYVEIVFNSVFSTAMAGYGYGYSFYILLMIPIVYYIIYNEYSGFKSVRRASIMALVGAVGVVTASVINGEQNKLPTVSDDVMYWFFIANMVICMGSVIYMSTTFIKEMHGKTMNLVEKNHELDMRANYDMLTNILNRGAFFEGVEKFINKNPDSEYAMLFLDIMDFKLVNDLFGEKYGDDILVSLADELTFNIGRDGVVGRFGGDRFVCCLEQKNYNEDKLLRIISNLRKRYSKTNYQLHVYVGVYRFKGNTENVNKMCDKAMYAVRDIKGDLHKVVEYYDVGRLNQEFNRQKYISEIEGALNRGQFEMYLQPQVNKNGEALGAEALVRWNHPELGMLMPGEFIEIFEEAGLIYKLDRYIWNEAAKKLGDWEDRGYKDYYISVNISAKDFYYIDVFETIDKIVMHNGIEKENLHLEITETALMIETSEARESINKLREAGYVLEIDDFGSGYSSFKFMKDTKVDVIKIDREFLKETENFERSKEILKAIIELSNALNMSVISEGVETLQQLEMLSEMGCGIFQGYYFSKPTKVSEFEERYFANNNQRKGYSFLDELEADGLQ